MHFDSFEPLDQIIHSFGLFQKYFEFTEGQGTGPVTFRFGGIGVGFEKKPADPLTHSCKHKVEYRLSSSIRRITPASRDLEGMSDIEHNRASGGFHNSKIEGIHDEIVIPEGVTTLAEQNLFISRFREFINYVSHLMGGKELRLFDINRSSGLG